MPSYQIVMMKQRHDHVLMCNCSVFCTCIRSGSPHKV